MRLVLPLIVFVSIVAGGLSSASSPPPPLRTRVALLPLSDCKLIDGANFSRPHLRQHELESSMQNLVVNFSRRLVNIYPKALAEGVWMLDNSMDVRTHRLGVFSESENRCYATEFELDNTNECEIAEMEPVPIEGAWAKFFWGLAGIYSTERLSKWSHQCDLKTTDCVDTPQGYDCACKARFIHPYGKGVDTSKLCNPWMVYNWDTCRRDFKCVSEDPCLKVTFDPETHYCLEDPATKEARIFQRLALIPVSSTLRACQATQDWFEYIRIGYVSKNGPVESAELLTEWAADLTFDIPAELNGSLYLPGKHTVGVALSGGALDYQLGPGEPLFASIPVHIEPYPQTWTINRTENFTRRLQATELSAFNPYELLEGAVWLTTEQCGENGITLKLIPVDARKYFDCSEAGFPLGLDLYGSDIRDEVYWRNESARGSFLAPLYDNRVGQGNSHTFQCHLEMNLLQNTLAMKNIFKAKDVPFSLISIQFLLEVTPFPRNNYTEAYHPLLSYACVTPNGVSMVSPRANSSWLPDHSCKCLNSTGNGFNRTKFEYIYNRYRTQGVDIFAFSRSQQWGCYKMPFCRDYDVTLPFHFDMDVSLKEYAYMQVQMLSTSTIFFNPKCVRNFNADLGRNELALNWPEFWDSVQNITVSFENPLGLPQSDQVLKYSVAYHYRGGEQPFYRHVRVRFFLTPPSKVPGHVVVGKGLDHAFTVLDPTSHHDSDYHSRPDAISMPAGVHFIPDPEDPDTFIILKEEEK